jgi:AcrR family transcriptional regulator
MSTPSKTRREAERQKMRQLILSSARVLFAERGVESVTLRAIAHSISYTPGAIYKHFDSKEQILQTICEEDFMLLANNTTQVMKISDPVERIKSLGMEYVRFAVDHPHHYRLMFMTQLNIEHSTKFSATKGSPHQDGYALLEWSVDEALRAGRLREAITATKPLIAQTLWAGVHGVASLQITMCDDTWFNWEPLSRRIDLMVSAITESLFEPAGGR